MIAEDMPSIPAGKAVYRGIVKYLDSGESAPQQVLASSPDEACRMIAERVMGVTYGDPEDPKPGDPDPLEFFDNHVISTLMIECRGEETFTS